MRTTRKKLMIKWKKVNKEFVNGMDGMAGKHKLFTLDWSMYPKGDRPPDKNYVLRCYLPGVKLNQGFHTKTGGRNHAEIILDQWLIDAGLKE